MQPIDKIKNYQQFVKIIPLNLNISRLDSHYINQFMKEFLLFLFSVTLSVSLRSQASVPNKDFNLAWQFHEDSIKVEIKSKTLNKVQFLLQNSELGSDLWICSVQQTSWAVKYGWMDQHLDPKHDTSLGGYDDINHAEIHFLQGEVVWSFERKLNTGDPRDAVLERGKTIKVCSFWEASTNSEKRASKDVRYCFYWPLLDNFQGQLTLEIQSNTWHLVHGIVLTICWGFLIDISLMVVRFLRTVRHYKLSHLLIMLCISLASIPFIILMIVKNRVNIFSDFESMENIKKVHFIFGFSILVLIVIQLVIGVCTKLVQQSITLHPKRYQAIRAYHKLVGYMLFVLTKIQILIGWWIYGASAQIIISVLVFWFMALLVVRMFFIDLYSKGKLFWLIKFFEKSIDSNKKSLSDKLLQESYFACDLSTAIEAQKSRRSIMQQFPSVRYVFYKDAICELQKFNHPGGEAILQKVIGLDVTKYIFGVMPVQGTKTRLHEHSVYAKQFLESRAIGKYIKKQITLSDPTGWCIKSLQELTSNLFRFTFYNPTLQMDTNPKDYDSFIGRYFLLSTQQATRTYSLVLSELDNNIKYRSALLYFYASGFKGKWMQVTKESTTNNIVLIIKKYSTGVVSREVHFKKKLKSISGVYGLGLGIRPGVNIIITGGTGILPFLDLFDLVLKKVIFTLARKEKVQNLQKLNLYGIDYQNVYPSSKFVVYASFKSIRQLKHFEWLHTLHSISRHYNLDIFQMHIRQLCFKSLNTYKGKIDRTMFSVKFGKGTFSRLIVCGPSAMSEDILSILEEKQYDPESYLII